MKTRIMTVDLEHDLQSNRCKSLEVIVPKLLSLFDEHNIKATFFTTSNLLEKYESEIKDISKKHEIGSHSHTHSWLNDSNAEFEISHSKKLFKQHNINCEGFRAPGLITTKNHFRLLKKYKYSYDSSLGTFFPGRYNNLNLPKNPYIHHTGIQEFPIPTFIYPFINSGLSYLKLLHPISKTLPQRYMFYLHPWEFLKKEDLPKSNSLIKYFLRRNTGKDAWKIFKNHIKKEDCQWTSCKKFKA